MNYLTDKLINNYILNDNSYLNDYDRKKLLRT